MTTTLRFIMQAVIICALYTGELFVITDLFMAHTTWHSKRIVGHVAFLGVLYVFLIYNYGLSEDVWYIGLTAFVINNFLHKGKIRTRIWNFFIAYAVSVGGDGVICILINKFNELIGYNKTIWIVDDFIPHLSAFMMAWGISILFKKSSLYHKDKEAYNELSTLKCLGLTLIGIIYAMLFNIITIRYIYNEEAHGSSAIIFFGVYFTLFLVVLSVVHNQIMLKKKYASRENGILNKVLTKHLDTYSHLEEIDKASENMKKEIENDVEALASLIGEEEKKKLIPYIEIIKKRLGVEVVQVITGNEVVDAILHEKMMCASDIVFETNVSIPKELKFSLVDLCIIVGYTMDYVIKVCHRGNEKEKAIKIKGIWFKGYLMFEIWYTVDEGEGIQKIGYSKTPDELNTVIKCLKKYEGNLELTQDGNLEKIELSFNTLEGGRCLSCI